MISIFRPADAGHILEILRRHPVQNVELVVGQEHAVIADLGGLPDQANQLVGVLVDQNIGGGVEPAVTITRFGVIGQREVAKYAREENDRRL
jgi:hypothetical protein